MKEIILVVGLLVIFIGLAFIPTKKKPKKL